MVIFANKDSKLSALYIPALKGRVFCAILITSAVGTI